MKTQILITIKIFALFTILLGIVYPLFITGIAQLAFPGKANGSLIVKDNKVIGSELIGQKFDSAVYFSSRPSAIDYNPLSSGGSNFGPTSTKLKQLVTERKAQWMALNQLSGNEKIPSEMLYASASGLDPHISPEAALLQVDRIVNVRQLDNNQKQKLMASITALSERPQFSVFGENRINVLALNVELDKLTNK